MYIPGRALTRSALLFILSQIHAHGAIPLSLLRTLPAMRIRRITIIQTTLTAFISWQRHHERFITIGLSKIILLLLCNIHGICIPDRERIMYASLYIIQPIHVLIAIQLLLQEILYAMRNSVITISAIRIVYIFMRMKTARWVTSGI